MRIKKLLAFFLSMSFIVCSLPTFVFADEVDGAGASDDPIVENVGDNESDPEDVAGVPADVKQGENGSGEVKDGSDEVSGAPVVRGQNDNDGGSGDTVYSGTCGEGLKWTYSPIYNLLDIHGVGQMNDYSETNVAPWSNFREDIKSVKIGSGVENIGNWAFWKLKNIKSVAIPESVKSIGDNAFYSCENLEYVVILEGVTSIGNRAFYMCSSLTNITIPDSVTSIGEHAFVETCLKEITIPESVISTGDRLFDNCSNLTKITSYADPTQLDEQTFDGIQNETIVYVPQDYFDKYCSRFSALSNQIKDIDTGVHGGGSTTTTTAPTDNPITVVPIITPVASGTCGTGVYWEFYSDGELRITGSGSMDDFTEGKTPWSWYNKEITKIKINNQVEKIGNYAFSNLSQLQTVTIPDNIKILGDYVFAFCYKLTDIYCYPDPISFSDVAFDSIGAANTIIHVKYKLSVVYSLKYQSYIIADDLSYVDLLGNTVVLSDQIGVNYYLDYSKEIDISDLSVEFKWGKGSNAKTVSGTFIQNSDYSAKCITSCSVPARCMTDSIKMTVKKGDDIVVSSTFKIAKYANDLTELYPAENVTTSDYIGLQDNQKLHTLLRAMLDYGAESQKYFNYNTDDLANAKKYTKNLVTVGSVSSSTKSAYSNYDATTIGLIAAKNTIANIGDDNIGLAYDGSAVACKSKLSVRIYFTKTEGFDMSNLSASYKGKALTFKEDGDSVYLQIDGMSPKAYAPKGSDLFDCGLTININGKDYTYTYLDYVQKCVATENGFEDTAVALAVYSYFAANY